MKILSWATLLPPPGERKIAKFGDESDLRAKRMPRIDRMSMVVAKQAIERAGVPTETMGLVLGTGYGGLQATVDFLEGIAARGPAFGSPTAFHESVHHAASGQISIALKIKGPSLTCSSRDIAGEAALKAGLDLIALGRLEHVLVISADEVVPAFEVAFRAVGSKLLPAEGAAAVVLGRSGGKVEIAELKIDGGTTGVLRFAEGAPALPDGFALNPSEGLVRIAQSAEKLSSAAVGTEERLRGWSLGGATASTLLRTTA